MDSARNAGTHLNAVAAGSVGEQAHCRLISDFVAQQAELAPHAEAVVLGGARWSYLELHRRVRALAKALLAAGISRGDRVCTLQTPCPEFLICLLATASVGAIWVGLNPRFRRGELEHVVADADPKLLISRMLVGDRSYASDIEALRAHCATLERVVTFEDSPTKAGVESMAAFLQRGADVPSSRLLDARAACDPRDACMIVYTSGSTGMPKGALLHHEGICTFSRTQNALWPVKPLRILNYFPINHIGCTIDVTLPCLAAGGTVIFMEQFDAAASLELMQKERVTVWASVPSGFAMQLALPEFSRADFSAVQLILWEGAQMPVQMLRTLRGIGPRLATNYGMTETTSAITALAPTDDEEILANTVGSAFPGVEMRLVDPQGREVPEGTEGEVLARSAQNMLGYWRNPEATRGSFTDDGFFRTGDLAIRREDGRYRLMGRLKEMFKSGGYNVYPREIETVLEEHPAVALAAVVPASDPLWQEVGVAFVVPKSAIRAEELQDWCSARLANYKVPKRFELRKSLPLLPIGKVDKVALREITDPSSASSTTPRR